MLRYRLAPTAFACACRGDIVILDVARNRYLAVNNAPTMDRHVIDWPGSSGFDGSAFPSSTQEADETRSTIGALLSRGLIERTHEMRSASTAPRIQRVAHEWTGDDLDDCPASWREACQFARIMLATLVRLRFTPLRRILDIFRAGRDRLATNSDPRAAQRLIQVFACLRPYALSATSTCLLDALALGTFLVSNGQRCSLVFGVRTRPFAAHCWLQNDATVMNDTIETVAAFTPIMVV
jgi:hypothetical protein